MDASLEELVARRRVEPRAIRTGMAHLHPPKKCRSAESALDWFEGLLMVEPAAGRMEPPRKPNGR